MTNYRDPKVTTSNKANMTWAGIALAVLLVLLLLWMFWPSNEEEVIAPSQEPAAEVVTPDEERVIAPSQDPDVDVVTPDDEPVPAPAE